MKILERLRELFESTDVVLPTSPSVSIHPVRMEGGCEENDDAYDPHAGKTVLFERSVPGWNVFRSRDQRWCFYAPSDLGRELRRI